MNVVVVAPHPDDEVIGCGGSIALHAASGDLVTVIVVIAREPSVHDAGVTDMEFSAELDEACRRLGVHEQLHLSEPSRDLQVDRRLVTVMASQFRRLRPDVVYLPHAGESDREHQMVGELCLEALWMAQAPFFPEAGPAAIQPPRLVLGYEVWTPMPRFQHVVDISGTIQRKVAAMRAYASQLRIRDYDRAILGLAAYRGVMSTGCRFAEVFGVVYLGAVQRGWNDRPPDGGRG